MAISNVDLFLVEVLAKMALTLLDVIETKCLSFPADYVNDTGLIAMVYDKNPRAAGLLNDYEEYTAITITRASAG